MATIPDIEAAVKGLSREELALFRDWFRTFDADAWDRQFEQDALSGRLDSLAQEAMDDLHQGRCSDL